MPLALLGAGLLFAALALLDKVVGIIQHPQWLAAGAYASLFGLLVWASCRGIEFPRARHYRPSAYAVFLLFNVLTATFLFALKAAADPTPWMLQVRLAHGDTLLENGRKEEAALLYRAAYRRYPDSFAVLMRMGASSYQFTDYKRARRHYERALAQAPRDARWRALNDLGQTLWKLQRPREAIDLYFQARDEGMPASEQVEWHYRLGWAYFDAHDYDAAVEHYAHVARAGGKYAAASYYNIACALAQKLESQPELVNRNELVTEAVRNLREAWRLTDKPDEKAALHEGLLGSEGERDPELEPLRSAEEFQLLLAEIRAG